VPVLYYGSEIEFQAGEQIDCGPTCPLAGTGRAYFGDHLEGDLEVSDFGEVDFAGGAGAEPLESALSAPHERLHRIRRSVPARRMGQYSVEGVEGDIAFKRRYTDDDVDSFALVAITDSATFDDVPDGTYVDAVSGDVQEVTDGSLTAQVSGQGDMAVYVLDLPDGPAPGQIEASSPYLD